MSMILFKLSMILNLPFAILTFFPNGVAIALKSRHKGWWNNNNNNNNISLFYEDDILSIHLSNIWSST